MVTMERRPWYRFSLRRLFVYGGLLIIVIVTLVIIEQYLYTYTKKTENVPAIEKTSDQSQIKGSIYLTLTPLDGSLKGRTDTYAFDVENKGRLTRLAGPNDATMTFGLRGIGSGMERVVFVTLAHAAEAPSPEVTLVTTYDFSKKEAKFLADLPENNKEYTKQFPSWSESLGGALYMTYTVDSPQKAPEDFSVYFSDSVSAKRVTSGMYPQFLPDGRHFIVLKNDGLYLLEVGSDASRKIFGVPNNQTGVNQAFDISGDGTKLAWTWPAKGKTAILNLENIYTGDGELTAEAVVPSGGFLPVLSPDGKQLVSIRVSPSSDNGARKGTLMLLDLTTKQEGVLLDLSGFDIEKSSVTDWVKK